MKHTRERIGLDHLHTKNALGQNCTVAVLDTGVHPHIDFCLCSNRFLGQVDTTKRQSGRQIPSFEVEGHRGDSQGETRTMQASLALDLNGHGTAVAGILCGGGILSNGAYKGVAPKANLVSIKAVGDDGYGEGRSILQGMKWILENAGRWGIRVVCMSFGADIGDPDVFLLGVEALWESGIVVVAS
ncbi:MAG: S8 family serine peptidase, partial [Firmicutes bacterium]|nr:S8 family serine peptidase [Bacillota bacterium]